MISFSLGNTIIPDIYNGAIWVCSEILVPLAKLPFQIFWLGTVLINGAFILFSTFMATMIALVWMPIGWCMQLLGTMLMIIKIAPDKLAQFLSYLFSW